MFGPSKHQGMSPQQAIAQARSYVGGDPVGAVGQMAQSNPQVADLLRCRTPRQACYEVARQYGIPLDDIIGRIGGGR